MAQGDWQKNLNPEGVEGKSDEVNFDEVSKGQTILRQIEVAYSNPMATPQEVLGFFRKDIERMCILDGLTLSELDPNPIRAVKCKEAFRWTINVLLKKSEVYGSRDPYFGMKEGQSGVRSGTAAPIKVIKTSHKGRDLII